MGFVGSTLGLNGGVGGSGFQAHGADVQMPTTVEQANQTYDQAQAALQQQQAFANALQAQNGIGNQSSVFNQMQGVANGTGPNPAMAQLNNATGANVANQAALMAGSRGVNANAGLLARQAAMQGGAIQQQAAGQGAALQAQQSLGALNQLGGIAGQQVGQQANALQGLQTGRLQAQQNVLGGIQGQNAANVQNWASTNSANAGVQQGQSQLTGTIVGGAMSGAGVAAQPAAGKHATGGIIPGQAEVKGDSLKNDKVPAMLSPGEMVIPRSVMESENPALEAAKFVHEHLKKSPQAKKNFATGGIEADPESTGQDLPAVEAPAYQGAPGGALNAANSFMNTFVPGGSDSMKASNDYYASHPIPGAAAPDAGAETPMNDVAPIAEGNPGEPIASNGPMPNGAIPIGGERQSLAPKQGGAASSKPYEMGQGLQGGVSELKKGIQLQSQAEQDQTNAEGVIFSRAQKDQEDLNKNYAVEKAQIDADVAQSRKDVADGKINPNRVLGEMGTGQRISSAIGLILGGIGGALTHQENPAMKFLNNQIDNDIKAQEKDLGKKETLLSMNMKRYGDLAQATQATRAQMMDMTSIELKAAAAKSGSKEAQARALQATGKLDYDSSATFDDLAKKRTFQKMAAAGNVEPEQLVPGMVPEPHQKQVFTEIQQAKAANSSEAEIKRLFEQAAKENTVVRTVGGLRTPPSIKGLNLLFDPLIHDNEGRINELEQRHVQANAPQQGDMPSTIDAKWKALQAFVNHKKQAPTAKAFNIDLENFKSTSSNPETRLEPQQKQYLQWARANAKDPRAQTVFKKLGVQ